MAAPSPIAWATIRTAIHTWFAGQTGLSVTWAFAQDGNQVAPELAPPYGLLNLISGPRYVHKRSVVSVFNDANPNGQKKELHFNEMAEFTVSCQVISASTKPADNALEYLGRAQMALNFPSVRKALRAAKVAVANVGDPIDLTAAVQGLWQSRASMDVIFRTNAHVLGEKGTFIETVNIDITTKGGTSDHASSLTIPATKPA